ncbi:cytidylyltransferase domain-containing protein, partial [Treponema pallidum]|uniref:cytidylyltransferase domain-containing protein n=1 Tax=Treponema pallidum TaxID=160 RepID=UPI001589D6C3
LPRLLRFKRVLLQATRVIPAETYILACDEHSKKDFEPVARAHGFYCISGSAEDVLHRFCIAVKAFEHSFPIRTVVRVTGDNPFLFHEAAAAALLRYAELNEPDYFTFTGLPYGSGVEILKARSLLLADRLPLEAYDREHVGPALHRRPGIFVCVREPAAAAWYHPDVRVTVDTQEDFQRAQHMMEYVCTLQCPFPLSSDVILDAYAYARQVVVFVPSVKIGQGAGHLYRAAYLVLRLQGRVRCCLYVPDRSLLCKLSTPFPEELIVDTVPADASLIVVDNFRTSTCEIELLQRTAPVLALDEGGSGRLNADYLIDVFPVLQSPGRRSLAALTNVRDSAFIPLPETRKEQDLPVANGRFFPIPGVTTVLVVYGAEDTHGRARSCAERIAALGFDTSVVVPGEASERTDGKVHIYPSLPHLKEHLHRWDVVVTHFGFTAFEAAAAGAAVLLVSPTPYHFLLSSAVGFSVIRSADPAAHELWSQMQQGIIIPDVVTRHSQCRDLADEIMRVARGKKHCCPFCGEMVAVDVVGRALHKTFQRCNECDMIFLSFVISDPVRYSESYFFEEYKAQYGKTYLEDFDQIRMHGARRMEEIERLYAEVFCADEGNSFAVDKKVLDVGCAYGAFLSAAKAAGWNAVGVDVCEFAVRHVRDTLCIPACVATFPLLPECFDFVIRHSFATNRPQQVSVYIRECTFSAVTLWFVIEHFQDLEAVLRKVADLLVPGGILAFSTPNFAGVTGMRFPHLFFAQSPCDHFTIWDARTVKKQLLRYGFTVKKIVVTGHHPERFYPHKHLKSGGLKWKMLMALSKWFQLGDTMEVYAIKQGDAHGSASK